MLPPAENQPHSLLPIVGVSGYSGSGKTTLVEEVVSRLVRRGLRIAVLKHSSHLLTGPGQKDTDRFLRAGAPWVAVHSGETVVRYQSGIRELNEALRGVSRDTDAVIVEGYKQAAIPKVWMEGPNGSLPPDLPGTIRVLKWEDTKNPEHLVRIVENEMRRVFDMRRILGGILGGGQSRRMGVPKALLSYKNKTFYDCVQDTLAPHVERVLGLGVGCYPQPGPEAVLPDIPGLRGPLAGLLSAARWAPEAAWLVCGVDMPRVTEEAVRWLLGNREPGFWAVIPRIQGSAGVEPLLACYEPMIFPLLEARASEGVLSLQNLAQHPKVKTPRVPEELVASFTNVNTPDEAGGLPGCGGPSPIETAGPETATLPEEHLQRIQKMETLASLIPGFIHSLNNEFTAIKCSERLIENAHPEDPDLRNHGGSIREALANGSEAARAILSFCESSEQEAVLNLVERVRKAVTLLKNVVGRGVQIQLDVAREAIPVRGNGQALLHALVAVGQNAAEAIPEGGGLRLRVDVLKDEQTARPLGCISFRDSAQGRGVTPGTRTSEPFFTTQTGRDHPGPGLTVARRIIEAHQGRITVTSEPGTGTRLSLCIPIADV